jgi:hypothetical protein
MKKTKLIVSLALGLVATQAFGQGTVNFGNNSSSAVTNSFTMARVINGTTFRVALYYLPDQVEPPTLQQFLANGQQLGASSIIQPQPGLYAAGTRTTPNTTPGSGFAWFQVRSWESAFGTSYEEAVARGEIGGRLAYAGTSNIIRVKTGDPANGVTPGALTSFGLQGFILTQVPEPATIGIAAIGIGALLLLRRKKS